MEIIPLLLLVLICLALLFGYPVAFTLSGVSILFALICIPFGIFDESILKSIPLRIFGIMNNVTLLAVPLFIFMGTVLERSGIAAKMLENMALAFKNIRGGLSISIIAVGALLAASTGIVGATVVTMGLMSLPTMLERGYHPSKATGLIAATGTLGQIIPPSIALVLLGDTLSNAYQQAQLNMGIFSPKTVSIGDLFLGAIVPGLILVFLYSVYLLLTSQSIKETQSRVIDSNKIYTALRNLLPPVTLIIAVLGSILGGFATPTEAAGVGAFGASLLASFKGKLDLLTLNEVSKNTVKVTSMVFFILIGAAIFSLVFRGFGGDTLVENFFEELPGGVFTATLIVMVVIFVLGFILDFIEITFVVVPIVGPVLLAMGLDPVWLGVMIAINLQTSFLTPPFGFALFYLRGVAPQSVQTLDMYKGVIPFIVIQLFLLISIWVFPEIATWLPSQL